MPNLLSISKIRISDILAIKSALTPPNSVTFDDIIADYVILTCYAEFEGKVNEIINAKLSKSTAFSKRYVSSLQNGSKKQLHGHLSKDNLKKIIHDVFSKKTSFNKKFSDTDWNMYVNFIKLRDSIAHHNAEYDDNKRVFLTNIGGDYTKIAVLLEKILDIINP